jgi:hypothetical protein
MTVAEQKARTLIASRSTEELVRDFEVTENLNTPEVPMIRGWYMDELEKRDQEAFDSWIDSDEESPRKFFLN